MGDRETDAVVVPDELTDVDGVRVPDFDAEPETLTDRLTLFVMETDADVDADAEIVVGGTEAADDIDAIAVAVETGVNVAVDVLVGAPASSEGSGVTDVSAERVAV